MGARELLVRWAHPILLHHPDLWLRGMAQIRAVPGLADHVPDAAGGGQGLLVDGGLQGEGASGEGPRRAS